MGEGVEHDEHNELTLKKSIFINEKQHVLFYYIRLIYRVEKIERLG